MSFRPILRVSQLISMLACCLSANSYSAVNHFEFTINTTLGNNSQSFILPYKARGNLFNYNVDCNNDGTNEATALTGPYTCIYASHGIYTISISDNTGNQTGFTSFSFNNSDAHKLISHDNWGSMKWTDLTHGFAQTPNLLTTGADVPDFSALTKMSSMFFAASQVNPSTSNWNTSNVQDMSLMFRDATAAEPDTSNWDTSNVTNMASMFYNATKANPNTLNWDTANVTTMDSMFKSATVANPDTSNWDTSAVTTMKDMFNKAKSAQPITNSWDTSKVTNMYSMFRDALIADPDTSGWKTHNVTNMASMFANAYEANPVTTTIGDIWNTSNVTIMEYMFYDAKNAEPDTSGWAVDNVTNVGYLFKGAVKAKPDTTNWNTGQMTDMRYMFSGASSADPDTSGWDTSKVTNMTQMFHNAIVANPDVTLWNTSNVTKTEYMFRNAFAAKPNVSNWDTAQITTMFAMFGIVSGGVGVAIPNMEHWVLDATSAGALGAILGGTQLPTQHYDRLLDAWSAQVDTNNSIIAKNSFGAGASMYCMAEPARDNLTGTHLWLIDDDGKDCSSVAPDLVDSADDGFSNVDDNTSVTTPTFSVYCAQANAQVKLYSDKVGFSAPIGSHICLNEGYEEITATTSLADTSHEISFSNTLPSATEGARSPILNIVIDTSLRLRAPDLQATSDSGVNNDDYTATVNPTFDIYCPAVNDELRLVYGSSDTQVASVTCPNKGIVSVVSTATLTNATYALQVIKLNGALVETERSPALNVTIDNTVPTPIITLASFPSPNNVAGKTTITGTISGDFSDGDTVTLTVNLVTYSGQINATGHFSININTSDFELDNTIEASITTTSATGISGTATDSDRIFSYDDAFIFTIKTDNLGASGDTEFTLPLYGANYDYRVDCDNDGNFDASLTDSSYTCTYATEGTYTVVLSAAGANSSGLPRFSFNNGDSAKLLTHDQWGASPWQTMHTAFKQAINLTSTGSDIPNFTQTTDFSEMFHGATIATPTTDNWDTSNVQSFHRMFSGAELATPNTTHWTTANALDMSEMFKGATMATPVTDTWVTGNVTNMSGMFQGATKANPNTANWDTSNVLSMQRLFEDAKAATPNTSGWNTASVTSMQAMFKGATLATPVTTTSADIWNTENVTTMANMFESAVAATPDTAGWNTTKVTTMEAMFKLAQLAQPTTTTLGDVWNVASVTNMREMFKLATNVNPDITGWEISQGIDMTEMFSGVKLPTANYDALIIHWLEEAEQNNITFDGGLSNYCLSELEHQSLVDPSSLNWQISDAGKSCSNTTDAPDLTDNSDLGTLNNDNITALTTPSFSVVCPTPITSTFTPIIHLYSDNPVVNTLIATHQCDNPGTVAVTSNTLAAGTHHITYTQTPNGVALAPSSALEVVIDPAPSVQLSLNTQSVRTEQNATVIITFDQVVSGFEISDINSNHGLFSSLQPTQMTNQWQVKFTPSNDIELITTIRIDNGSFENASGQLGLGNQATLAIDTLAPSIQVTIDPIDRQAAVLLPQGISLPVSGQVFGEYNSGDTVTLTINDINYSGTVDSTGRYSIAIPFAQLDTSNSIITSVTTTDLAGNQQQAQTTRSYGSLNTKPVAAAQSLSMNAGTSLAVTLSASDADNDSLSFVLLKTPENGALSGSGSNLTYHPNSGFFGTDSFIFSATDPLGQQSEAQVSITVLPKLTAVNDDFSATSWQPILLDVLANDDVADISNVTITAKSSTGNVSIVNGKLKYTPQGQPIGEVSVSYTISLGDQTSTATVRLTYPESLRAPLLAMDDKYTITSWDPILLDVLANDVLEDTTIVELVAYASRGSVNTVDGQLEYTPQQNVAGDIQITYSISYQDQTSEATVTISFPSSIAPQITLPADLCDDLSVDANALYTKVDLGEASAVDRFGNPLPVSLLDNRLLYPAGRNLAYWRAEDAAGVVSIQPQAVCVNPLVSTQKDQDVLRSGDKKIAIYLNGLAPAYPVTVEYQLTGNDNTVLGSIDIEQGTSAIVDVNDYAAQFNETQDTITLTLTDKNNRGSHIRSAITLSEQPPVPEIDLLVSQNQQQRIVVAKDQGVATITANIEGVSDYQGYQFVWNSTLDIIENLSNQVNQYTFDLNDIAVGSVTLSLTIIDPNGQQFPGEYHAFAEVVSELTALENTDSDGDSIPDSQEGYHDRDGDFIPDYLDRISECNVLQQQQSTFDGYLIEGDAGVCLRRGNSTIGSASGGAQISQQDIDNKVNERLFDDNEATNVGGIFDYIAHGALTKDASFAVAIPQRKPIPLKPVYRKLTPEGSWINFVEDGENSLWSAAGEPGYCPPPNRNDNADNPWRRGLTPGHWCVQMILTDGGANDDDSVRNGYIVDPGGVAVLKSSNNFPVAVNDSAQLNSQYQVIIDALANDTDADDNALTITSAHVSIGNVTIENNQLFYQGSASYQGDVIISYGIDDGAGGTDLGQVTVKPKQHKAITLVNDTASTDDTTPISIDVLANDINGNTLTLTKANSDSGSVVIVGNQLVFNPAHGNVGLVTITYQVEDNKGNSAQAKLAIEVSATRYRLNSDTTSSGGSMFYLLMLFMLIVASRSPSTAFYAIRRKQCRHGCR